MEFKAYRESEDYNYDNIYSFIPLGSSEKEYKTDITIDWLNMDAEENGNVIRLSCNCQDYIRRRRTCKHLRECLSLLKNDMKIRKEELKRYWCSTCHGHCNTSEENPKCYYCKLPLLESDIK